MLVSPEEVEILAVWFLHFSCPSSSIPTLVRPSVTINNCDITSSTSDQINLTYLPDLLPWPTWPTGGHNHLTCPPTWYTNPFILLTYLIYPPTQITSQNRKITSQNRKITSLNPQITFLYFVVQYRQYNFDQISQFWPNFKIPTKFHNDNSSLQCDDF